MGKTNAARGPPQNQKEFYKLGYTDFRGTKKRFYFSDINFNANIAAYILHICSEGG